LLPKRLLIKYFLNFLVFFQLPQIFSQTPNLDSLSKTFVEVEDANPTFYAELDSFKTQIEFYKKTHKPDKQMVDAMQTWAKFYADKEPLISMKEYEASINIANKIDYQLGLANGKHEIGLLYMDEGLYNIATENLNQSSILHKKNKQWWQYGFSLVDIGNVYFKLKEFKTAREYYHMAYNIFTQNQFVEKYEYAVSVCYNNLGLCDFKEKKYSEALINFHEGLHWRQLLKLEEYYGHSYKYIANCYKEMGQFDTARMYYEIALKYDKAKGPKIELIKSYLGLGKLLICINNNNLASQNLFQAYKISKEYGMIPMIIQSANEISEFYLKTNNIDSSINYSLIALKYAKTFGNIDGREEACQRLVEINRNKGDYKDEIIYLEELLDIEKQKQIDVALKKQLEYEVNKRLIDSQILESKNKVQTLIILAVLIILSLTIYLVLYFFKSRKKYIWLNKKLEKKNTEIIEQKHKLEQSNLALSDFSIEIMHQKEEITTQAESLSNAIKQLKELQEFKEGMTAMIVHDLKNPLNTILNQTKNITVYDSANQMLNMVNNILDLQKYENTNLPITKRTMIINSVLEDALYNTRYLTEQKNIRIKNQTPRKYEVQADPELMERVFTNLLSNAIKYSPLNATIKIKAHKIDSTYLKISILDNGPGISENEKNLIFEKFTQLISHNLGHLRSTGLGLAFCKMAIEAHQGKIGVEENNEGGAIFWFTIPQYKINQNFEFAGHDKISEKIYVSDENLNKILPYTSQLKQTAIYEIAEIRKIIEQIKLLGIPNINQILLSIENSGYSANEENFINLINELENLNK
jgi:signal transduction histidine kinase/Tfp pilus assembly protein PilF